MKKDLPHSHIYLRKQWAKEIPVVTPVLTREMMHDLLYEEQILTVLNKECKGPKTAPPGPLLTHFTRWPFQFLWGKQTFTWFSTSMAMSTNMSCSSLMLLSSRTMSLCRASISLSACCDIPELTICRHAGPVNESCELTNKRTGLLSKGKWLLWFKHKLLSKKEYFTPAVKTAAFPPSSICSSSSSVVDLPATSEQENGFMQTGQHYHHLKQSQYSTDILSEYKKQRVHSALHLAWNVLI